MALNSSNPDQLEETLESTRRSVRQLEIEAYRIRHDLTRIEAELVGGLAPAVPDQRRAASEVALTERAEPLAPTISIPDVHPPLDELAARTDAALLLAERLDHPLEDFPADEPVSASEPF